jgi:hypothetical protein
VSAAIVIEEVVSRTVTMDIGALHLHAFEMYRGGPWIAVVNRHVGSFSASLARGEGPTHEAAIAAAWADLRASRAAIDEALAALEVAS